MKMKSYLTKAIVFFLLFSAYSQGAAADKLVTIPRIPMREKLGSVYRKIEAKMTKLPDTEQFKGLKYAKVYKIIFTKIDTEFATKFAREHFDLTGTIKITGDENDFLRIRGKDNDWVLCFETKTGSFDYRNYEFHYKRPPLEYYLNETGDHYVHREPPHSWKDEKDFPSDEECKKLAIEYLEKYKLFEDDLYIREVRQASKYKTVSFGQKIDGFKRGGPGASLWVDIGSGGRLVFLYKSRLEVESIGEYPLMPVDKAYEKLLQGKGAFQGYSLRSGSQLQLGEVRNVSIIYHFLAQSETKRWKEYAQPFYHFEFVCGPDDMTTWGKTVTDGNIIDGYYPAISEEYLEP